jgi:peptidoglycan/LPS O-acetylase OafA/YrhL
MIGVHLAQNWITGQFWLKQALLRYLAALLVTTLLATASYYLLESPFLRWKLRFTRVNSRPGG